MSSVARSATIASSGAEGEAAGSVEARLRNDTCCADGSSVHCKEFTPMKPYIVAHMMSSVDGRSLTDGWNLDYASELYESTAATFEADGWICGRVTMQEISHGKDYPKGLEKEAIPRTDYFV